jgi:hydrogenase maturation factor
MRVLRLDAARGLALCTDDHGAHHAVETELVAPVAPGDELLVHAGVALVNLATTSNSDPGSDELSL